MGAGEISFIEDERGIDTVALKIVFYLVITGAVVFLAALSWNNVSDIYSGAKESKQINDAALALMSIQDGYARNVQEMNAAEGSICSIELSLKDTDFLAFGVDPDPDMNGNVSDTEWLQENNTIICQYRNGAREIRIIDGSNIIFRKGRIDDNGIWVPAWDDTGTNGVVIEGPASGNFDFELVTDDRKYTISHF